MITPGRGEPEARRRILHAAQEVIAAGGLAGASSGQIARAAGVSKALVHYHFSDKDALLIAVTEECRQGIVERAARRAGEGIAGEDPIDEFREWSEQELMAKDLRISIQLGFSKERQVRAAAREVLQAFEGIVQTRVAGVLAALAVEVSLPRETVGRMFSSTLEGMAARADESATGASNAIDALWLSLLSLER